MVGRCPGQVLNLTKPNDFSWSLLPAMMQLVYLTQINQKLVIYIFLPVLMKPSHLHYSTESLLQIKLYIQ